MPDTIFVLDFRRNSVQRVSASEALPSSDERGDVPAKSETGYTLASLGTPPRRAED
jgi:hypothetical protein